MHDTLRKLYWLYMSLWPGAALASVQFLPAVQEVWIGTIGETLILLLYCVLLAAVAIYLTFVVEVVPFPASRLQAVLLVVTVPLHAAILVFTKQSIWTALYVGCCIEITVCLVPIAFAVFQKMRNPADRNWFAATILLGTAVGFAAIAWPGMVVLIDRTLSAWVITISGIVTGSIQHGVALKQRPRSESNNEQMVYVLIGVGGFVFFPLGAFLWQMVTA